MENTPKKSFKALLISSLKCKSLIVIVLLSFFMQGENLIGSTMSSSRTVPGNWFLVDAQPGDTTVRITTQSISASTDSVCGIQLCIASDLLDGNGEPLFELDTESSWLFDGDIDSSILEDSTSGNYWVRVLRSSGFKQGENDQVLILDLSEVFPNGATEDELLETVNPGGGSIIVLDDIM